MNFITAHREFVKYLVTSYVFVTFNRDFCTFLLHFEEICYTSEFFVSLHRAFVTFHIESRVTSLLHLRSPVSN